MIMKDFYFNDTPNQQKDAMSTGKFPPRVWLPKMTEADRNEIARPAINFTNATEERIEYLSRQEHEAICLANDKLIELMHTNHEVLKLRLSAAEALLEEAEKELACACDEDHDGTFLQCLKHKIQYKLRERKR